MSLLVRACKRIILASKFILHLIPPPGWHITHIKELKIQICPKLKRMTRVIEKARLKGGNSVAGVKDIVRAMITVSTMDEVAVVMEVLCVLHEEGEIEVMRVKERFLEAPSKGGWRGAYRQ